MDRSDCRKLLILSCATVGLTIGLVSSVKIISEDESKSPERIPLFLQISTVGLSTVGGFITGALIGHNPECFAVVACITFMATSIVIPSITSSKIIYDDFKKIIGDDCQCQKRNKNKN